MKYWRKLFSTGYINPKDDFPDVTASQQSEIVSILSAGTFFGALFSAPLADILGRRWAMIFNTGVFTFGVILQTIATAIPMFVAGRFFAGLGVGLLSATIPLYQSETAPVSCGPSFHRLSAASNRVSVEMDSRRHCRVLPVGYHDRSLPCRHRSQFY